MSQTAADFDLTKPLLLPVRVEGTRIAHGEDDGELAAAIDSGLVVIFKGVFPVEQIRALRRSIVKWGEENPEFEHGKSASLPGINYHRRDDGTAPTSMPHIFHQYGFGNWDDLPDFGEELTAMSRILLDIQNRLSGTEFTIPADYWRQKAIRHPRGGGYLIQHRHPYLPQKVAIFLNFSEPGVDYDAGAARFKNESGWIDTHEDFRIGDVLAWRYDLVHDVSPTDPGGPLKWEGDDGLWIYALEAVEVHLDSKLEPA